LQNSLNDIFSLIRFLRLEPFLDRHVWNQYIGVLAQKGDELGTERLQAIMRYIALRRTKDTKDSQGKPILSLPPINNALVHLQFTEAERAFYASRHQRYKHDFAQMEANDSVMKNFCSILQELLKLRQICVHPALLQDTEDRTGANGGDLVATIEAHGISKPRAIQLLALMRDAGLLEAQRRGAQRRRRGRQAGRAQAAPETRAEGYRQGADGRDVDRQLDRGRRGVGPARRRLGCRDTVPARLLRAVLQGTRVPRLARRQERGEGRVPGVRQGDPARARRRRGWAARVSKGARAVGGRGTSCGRQGKEEPQGQGDAPL